jgi:hypothetical protein
VGFTPALSAESSFVFVLSVPEVLSVLFAGNPVESEMLSAEACSELAESSSFFVL